MLAGHLFALLVGDPSTGPRGFSQQTTFFYHNINMIQQRRGEHVAQTDDFRLEEPDMAAVSLFTTSF